MDTLNIIKKNQEYFDKNDLGEILSNAKKGLELYTTAYGGVVFDSIDYDEEVIACNTQQGYIVSFTFDGRIVQENDDSECVLFPSKDNRDWTAFKLPDEKFNVGDYVEVDGKAYKIRCIETPSLGVGDTSYELMPLGEYALIYTNAWAMKRIYSFAYKYLRPWEKILSKNFADDTWKADIFSGWHDEETALITMMHRIDGTVKALPINSETIVLMGTKNPAPEFYAKAWENK